MAQAIDRRHFGEENEHTLDVLQELKWCESNYRGMCSLDLLSMYIFKDY